LSPLAAAAPTRAEDMIGGVAIIWQIIRRRMTAQFWRSAMNPCANRVRWSSV
jgi:hypothetical protein